MTSSPNSPCGNASAPAASGRYARRSRTQATVRQRRTTSVNWTTAASTVSRLRLAEQAVAKDDPDPKALACYGLLLRADPTEQDAADQMWLRFVEGRPVSAVTIDYLDWCCRKLHADGKDALFLIWDNAPWHVSHLVRDWIRDHNRQVKQRGVGVRIIACYLPIKSPWLNAIEAT